MAHYAKVLDGKVLKCRTPVNFWYDLVILIPNLLLNFGKSSLSAVSKSISNRFLDFFAWLIASLLILNGSHVLCLIDSLKHVNQVIAYNPLYPECTAFQHRINISPNWSLP